MMDPTKPDAGGDKSAMVARILDELKGMVPQAALKPLAEIEQIVGGDTGTGDEATPGSDDTGSYHDEGDESGTSYGDDEGTPAEGSPEEEAGESPEEEAAEGDEEPAASVKVAVKEKGKPVVAAKKKFKL